MGSPHTGQDWTQLIDKDWELKPSAGLPDRYSIRRKGEARELVCSESPTLAVRIERSMAIPLAPPARRHLGLYILMEPPKGGLSLTSKRVSSTWTITKAASDPSLWLPASKRW